MQCRAVLLLALLVASAAAAAAQDQGQWPVQKVASCVAQVKKEAINTVNNAVGIAQTGGGSTTAPDTVGDYYAVSFSPGIGCFLMSLITVPPPPAESMPPGIPLTTTYQPGAIIAVSTQASLVTTNSFTCKFTSKNTVFTSAQISNLVKYGPRAQQPTFNNNNTAALFQLPKKLSDLNGKVRCSYMLYGKTGYNYTRGQSCVPTGLPDTPWNCTPVFFDTPSIQWHFDKNNNPALSTFTATTASITCKVDTTLLGRTDTLLMMGPNDGACYPGWARVVTPTGPKPMAQLAVGDRVLAVDPASGKAVWDEVYLVPHRDVEAAATYINIRASPVTQGGSKGGAAAVLTLSPTHYVPIACGANQQQQCLKHARVVAAGDLVWLLEGQQAVLARVDEVTVSVEQGLFSPWTLTGSIVVEGFAASTHTAWPYEMQLLQLLPGTHAIAAQHLLAKAHHAVQAPLRAAYRVLGKAPLALLDSAVYGLMGAAKWAPAGLFSAVHATVKAATAAA